MMLCSDQRLRLRSASPTIWLVQERFWTARHDMKNFAFVLVVAFSLVLLPGCGDKAEPQKAAVAEIEKQRERADREEKSKEEERKRRELAEERIDFWKTVTGVAVISGVIFTLVGIALGSSARRKAERSQPDE